MEAKTIWNIRELKKERGGIKRFRVYWSETKTDVRRGYSIVEAANEDEAERAFWHGDIIDEVEEDIDVGSWEDLQVDEIEEMD